MSEHLFIFILFYSLVDSFFLRLNSTPFSLSTRKPSHKKSSHYTTPGPGGPPRSILKPLQTPYTPLRSTGQKSSPPPFVNKSIVTPLKSKVCTCTCTCQWDNLHVHVYVFSYPILVCASLAKSQIYNIFEALIIRHSNAIDTHVYVHVHSIADIHVHVHSIPVHQLYRYLLLMMHPLPLVLILNKICH